MDEGELGGGEVGGVKVGVDNLRDKVGEVCTVAESIVGGEVSRGAVKIAEGRRFAFALGGGDGGEVSSTEGRRFALAEGGKFRSREGLRFKLVVGENVGRMGAWSIEARRFALAVVGKEGGRVYVWSTERR